MTSPSLTAVSDVDALSVASFEDVGAVVEDTIQQDESVVSLAPVDQAEEAATCSNLSDSDCDNDNGNDTDSDSDSDTSSLVSSVLEESDWVPTNDVHFVVRWKQWVNGVEVIKHETRSLLPPKFPTAGSAPVRLPGISHRSPAPKEAQHVPFLPPYQVQSIKEKSCADTGEPLPEVSQSLIKASFLEKNLAPLEEAQKLNPARTPIVEFCVDVRHRHVGPPMPPPRMPPPGMYPPPFRPGFRPPPPPQPKYDLKQVDIIASSVKIHSRHLINALRAVTEYYPEIDLDKFPVELPCNSYYLPHISKSLHEYKLSQYEVHDLEYANIMAEHVDVLIDAIEYTYGPIMEKATELEGRNVSTFTTMWTLMRPGTQAYFRNVYAKDSPLLPCIIHNVSPTFTEFQTGIRSQQVDVWTLAWKDGKFQRRCHTIEIFPFNGELDITKLQVFPARFQPPSGMSPSESTLGRFCWNIAAKEGPVYLELTDDYSLEGCTTTPTSSFMTRRLLVDYSCDLASLDTDSEFDDDSPSPPALVPPCYSSDTSLPKTLNHCQCQQCSEKLGGSSRSTWADLDDLDPRKSPPPVASAYYHAIDKQMPGWLFATQVPRNIHAKHVRYLTFSGRREHLTYGPPETKESIEALIKRLRRLGPPSALAESSSHKQAVTKSNLGPRMILLYGPTGTGKSATVEHIAESTRRPLFRLEPSLCYPDRCRALVGGTLRLCSSAGGIIFIDNAENFLGYSTTNDTDDRISRSTFINSLDDFRGTVLLTTRRPSRFDRSFVSRIGTAIHFPDLSDEQRHKIWNNKFHMLETASGSNRIIVSPQARVYVLENQEVAQLQWNGFEMQNALRNAIELAEDELSPSVANSYFIPGSMTPPGIIHSMRKGGPPQPPPARPSIIVLEHHFKAVVKNAVRLRSLLTAAADSE